MTMQELKWAIGAEICKSKNPYAEVYIQTDDKQYKADGYTSTLCYFADDGDMKKIENVFVITGEEQIVSKEKKMKKLKTISRAVKYTAMCPKCLSVVEFCRNDLCIIDEKYDSGFYVRCGECNAKVKVADEEYNLYKGLVTPIYEDDIETIKDDIETIKGEIK